MVSIFEEAVKQNTLKSINEVAIELELEQHVLRFWESKFSQISPIKAKGNRRLYDQKNIETIKLIKKLLYSHGYTITGARNYLDNGSISPASNDNISASSLDDIRTRLLHIRASLELLQSN